MYQLKVLSGSKAGQILTLSPGQPLVIGRGAEANLSVPDDPTLSRNHADLVLEGNQVVLRNRSQHGSLVGGQVVQGNAPVAIGQEFQVGGTRLVLAPMAGAAAGAPASGGMQRPGAAQPMGGGAPPPQPVGGPVGGGAHAPAGGGKEAGAAAMAAMKNLPSGPAKITHTGPGIPFMDIWKGAISVVLGNKMATLAMAAPILGLVFLQGLGFAIGMAGINLPRILLLILMIISGLLALVFAFGGPLLVSNYMAGVKEYQASGKTIGITDLIKFTDLINRYITFILVGVSACFCYVPILVTCWAIPIAVANPGLGFMNAIKASVAFGKKNIVQTLIFLIVGGILMFVMNFLCLAGIIFQGPIFGAGMMLAYLVKQDEIKAAAAEAGITLA